MENMVIALNHFFDLVWLPLLRGPWYIDFIVISVLSALLFLVIFKKLSNQKMIRFYKNRILGHIFSIRLYKDQPILTLKIVFSIFGCQLIYLKYMLTPLIVIFLPLIVVSVQLNNRYGYLPLKGEDHVLIEAKLDKTETADIEKSIKKIKWNTSSGIQIETPPLRMISEATVIWRAKVLPLQTERQFFQISVGGTTETVEKKIITAMTKERFSPEKRKWDLSGLFINNGEEFIEKTSPFKSITVSYERASYPFLAWQTDPVILYFILTLIFGLFFKPFIRVSI
ncbi:MAG: hypothetical protein ACE5DO_02255 [Desulfobacterales bacterium]